MRVFWSVDILSGFAAELAVALWYSGNDMSPGIKCPGFWFWRPLTLSEPSDFSEPQLSLSESWRRKEYLPHKVVFRIQWVTRNKDFVQCGHIISNKSKSSLPSSSIGFLYLAHTPQENCRLFFRVTWVVCLWVQLH